MVPNRFTLLAFLFFFTLILVRFSLSQGFILILPPTSTFLSSANLSLEEYVTFKHLKFAFVNSSIEEVSKALETFKNASVIRNYEIKFSEVKYNATLNLNGSYKLCLIGSTLKDKIRVRNNDTFISIQNVSSLWDFLKGLNSCINNGSNLIIFSKPHISQIEFQVFPLIFDELAQEDVNFVVFLGEKDDCFEGNTICLKKSNESYVEDGIFFFNDSLVLSKFLNDLKTLRNITGDYVISRGLLLKTFNFSLANLSYEIGNTLFGNECYENSSGFLIFKNGTIIDSTKVSRNASQVYSFVCFQYNETSRKVVFNFTRTSIANFSVVFSSKLMRPYYFNISKNLTKITINSTSPFYTLYLKFLKRASSNYFFEDDKFFNLSVCGKHLEVSSKTPINYKQVIVTLYSRVNFSIFTFLLRLSNYTYFFYLPAKKWISLGTLCHVEDYRMVGCKYKEVIFMYWDSSRKIWRSVDLEDFVDKPYGFFAKNVGSEACYVLLKCGRNYKNSLNIVGGWNLISMLSEDYLLSLSTLLSANKTPIFNIIAVKDFYCFNISKGGSGLKDYGFQYQYEVTISINNLTRFLDIFKTCRPFSFWIYVAQDIRAWSYYYPTPPNPSER